MRTICAVILAALLAPAAWAADTDVENPALRDLPMYRGGPISGGRQHQPTPAEVQERAADRSLARPGEPREAMRGPQRAGDGQSQDLYNRVINQSDRPTPRSIEPTK
ncbi:MAG: hypothetical protein JO021_23745 [Alphaproteobacteria bacterium]|nr:hypothetical protein [Alphaproteobacteria bacterium]